MKKFAAACALACALLAVAAGAAGANVSTRGAAAAAGPIAFGVADDGGKYAEDGGKWFDKELKGANLGEERWTLSWSGGTGIDELAFLKRAAPQAQADGIKVELALYGRPASNNDPTQFCAWAANVATTAAAWGIHDFIVWNEPNTALYFSPQDSSSPAKYEALLAACYDSIHAADPAANVIGFGLSPRKGTATQTAPIPFIAGVAAAYKASGRTKPIMDMISLHPYPNPNSPTDGPDVGYADPNNYGIPNLDRVKQAIWDGFHGTAQPTTLNGLKIVLDEVGWQTDTTAYPQYIHAENVKTISEAQQVQYLKTATQKYFACDPSIATVNWFLLVDESTRDGKDASGNTVGGGWQSGLLTAGGAGISTAKQAYAALAPIWAQGRAACTGPQIDWSPSGGSGGEDGTGSDGGATLDRGTVDLAQLTDVLGSDAVQHMQTVLGALALKTIASNLNQSSLYGFVNGALDQIVGNVVPRAAVVANAVVVAMAGKAAPTPDQLWALMISFNQSRRPAAASGLTVLGSASATVKAGHKIRLKVRAVSKKPLAPGTIYLAVGFGAAGDASKTGIVFKKIATVQTKTTPVCKKGKKSTAKKPCTKR
ncbi:MAG: hypothetical protein ABUS54_07290 [Actinomycetota bacterium]